MGSVGSNAGLHTYRIHAWSDKFADAHVQGLLLASWLGAFSVVVYTTMLLFGSLYPSKCELEA